MDVTAATLPYHETFSLSELERKADSIMENFNFEEVHEHMVATNWCWHINGDMAIPEIDELKSTARYLLTNAIWDKNPVSHCGTGGFNAYKLPWGLKLEFVLTQS